MRSRAASKTPGPLLPNLSVRDQTTLAAFFGVYLGVDTRRWPELASAESLSEETLARIERAPYASEHWSLLRFSDAYRSAQAAIPAWGLVLTSLSQCSPEGDCSTDPALHGEWWIDGHHAYPRNSGVIHVSPSTFHPLVVSASAAAEREALAAELGDEVRGAVGWHVLALVRLKHT